ncbi:U3 small nucleolar RNA-associated protein [Thraustotheca clavata]|uniref:U3 small nucleolar RNA-associated protein n=1 Tax=Thraustotheca clavata TaxID=74557 RepID=A0A1W0A0X9_9STRA|nr:U3 small nucleolar RNA-associated protein [Thraustotheca clavata]
MPELLTLLLKAFAPSTNYTDEELSMIYDIVKRTCDLMRKHTTVKYTEQVWNCFDQATMNALTLYKEDPSAATAVYLSRQCDLLALWVAYKHGDLVAQEHKKVLYHTATLLLDNNVFSAAMAPELHESILNFSNVCILSIQERFYPLFKSIYNAIPTDDQNGVLINVRNFTLKMLNGLAISASMEYLVPHYLTFINGLSSQPSNYLLVLGELLNYLVKKADDISSSCIGTAKDGSTIINLAKVKYGTEESTKLLMSVAKTTFEQLLNVENEAKFIQHAAVVRQGLDCMQYLSLPEKQAAALINAFCKQVSSLKSASRTSTVVLTILHAKCLLLLARLNPVPKPSTILNHLDTYSASTFTIQALRCTMKKMDLTKELAFESLFERLQNNLRSNCQALRRETIELFTLYPALEYENTTDNSLQGTCEAIDLCMELENACANATVESERDIIRMLERLKVISRSAHTPRIYIQFIVAHMLGINHVKFSTIWPHIAIVIQACVALHFESVWGILCSELYYISNRTSATELADVPEDDENGLLSLLGEDVKIEEGLNQVVTDIPTHHGLVWKALEGFPNLVEQKSKVVVPIFCAFLRDQYYAIYMEDVERIADSVLTEVITSAETSRSSNPKYNVGKFNTSLISLATPITHVDLTTKAVREKLISFLHLFKRFTNYAGVFGQNVLWDFFYALLIKADDHISNLALECIYAYKPAYLLPYKTQLSQLTNSSTFREAITNFKVDKESGVVLSEHRGPFFPVLLRLLYAKFVSRKGSRSSKDSLATRRTVVLSFLVALESNELAYFIGLILRPFRVDVSNQTTSFADLTKQVQKIMPEVSASKQVGFLKLLEDVIAHLGSKVTVYLPHVLSVLAAILSSGDIGQIKTAAVEPVENDEEDEDDNASAEALKRQTRTLVFRRLADVVDQFDGESVVEECFGMLFTHCSSSIEHLPKAMRGAKKPSALLDWLRAIAESQSTVRILSTSIIKVVISCLSTGLDSDDSTAYDMGVSLDTLECLIRFLSGLLNADEKNESTPLLLPHLTFVLEQFIYRFKSKTAKFMQEKYAGSSKRELAFLCRLASHVQDNVNADAADQLIQLLLPFLTRSYRTSYNEKENVCDVVAGLVPCVADPKHHVSFLSKLIAPGVNCLSESGLRQKLMFIFKAIEEHPQAANLKKMCAYLVGLNAMDSKRLEVVDFEQRLEVFQEINADKFQSLIVDMTMLQPIISQYLFSMTDAEFSLRNAARAGLEAFTELAALEKEGSIAYHTFENVVMPCVRFNMKSQVEETRRGFIQLLMVVADSFEGHSNPSLHGDLSLLRNKVDPEVDFFYNMTHIQVHRRSRAIQRMRTSFLQKKLELSNTTVINIIVPLLTHVIYENNTKANEAMAVDAAQCLGGAATLLSWSHYYGLIRNLLKQIPGRPECENTIIAAVCSIIDNFHFEGTVVCEGWNKVVASKSEEEIPPTHIQQVMIDSLLPMLKNHLTKGERKKGKSKTGEKESQSTTAGDYVLRVPVALAIVKVLRRLPGRTFHSEFPKLLIQVTKLLRSKDESVRSSSRQTLVKIALELGPTYLLPIVSELEHSLTNGYMVHVLSYTLFAILEKVAEECHQEKPAPLTSSENAQADIAPVLSPLDECIPKILAILVRDIFGDIGEQRSDKAEFKSKMKEAKSCRSYDSFELVARCINFLPSPTIHVLLLPIIQTLESNRMNGKTLLNVRNVLQRIALGLAKNKSVEQSHMYLYIFNMLTMGLNRITYLQPDTTESLVNEDGVSSWLVCDWVADDKKKNKLQRRVQAWETFKIEAQARMTGYDRYAVTKAEGKNSGADEIMNFTFSLLYTILRNEDRSNLSFSLLDPFVPFIVRCLAEIKHNDTVINSLKCLALMLNHPLPTLLEHLSSIVDRIFKIIQRAGAATKNEMTQACYRALSILLREREEYKMTESQLRVLISFIRQDLDEMDHQNSTFALLKALLARKLVIPEVYDLMIRVGEMMIQNQVTNVRTNCANMYLTFLLDYPLGDKRLNYHIRFVVNNLTFEYESGRISALECLDALVKKLPSDMLDTRAQFFLLPLVLRLVNDEAQSCRTLAAEVISHLFQRVSAATFSTCTATLTPWWSSTDSKLQCAAAHVSSLVVVARPDLAKKSFIDPLLKSIEKLLKQSLNAIGEQDEDEIQELTWEPVYLTLLCVEKVYGSLSVELESYFARDTCILDSTIQLMAFPHAWIRLAASRTLNVYMGKRSASTLDYSSDSGITTVKNGSEYLKSRGKLFQLAQNACKQLESDHLVDDLAKEIVTILLFILRAFRSFPSIEQYVSALPNENDDDEDKEEKEENDEVPSPIRWLFTRLSFLARGYNCDLRKSTIYNFFAGVAVQEDASFLETILLQMLNPLYRDTTSEENESDTESQVKVKTIAREVLQLLEAKIDSQPFLSTYTHIQKKVTEFRERRKQKRKIEAIAEPEVAAKRKLAKNLQKQNSKQMKKRKIGELKGTQNKHQKMAAARERRKKARPGYGYQYHTNMHFQLFDRPSLFMLRNYVSFGAKFGKSVYIFAFIQLLKMESQTKSKLLEAKQRRKDVSCDAVLLQNRISLLRAEETRAWKKIEQTKKRAQELLKMRQEKDQYTRDRNALMTQAERELHVIQQAKREVVLASEKKEIDAQILDQKRLEAQQLKEDKQKWRQYTEMKKRQELEDAIRRREDIVKQQDHLRRTKQTKQAELERANKQRADSIIKREEQVYHEKELEVQEMEKLEMELIQRLRNTQHLQKQAYEELENALNGSFST